MIARLPFVGFVVFYAAGVLVGDLLTGFFDIDFYLVMAVSIVLAAISFWFFKQRRYTFSAVSFSLFLALSGFFSTMFHNQALRSEIKELSVLHYTAYRALVKTIPEKRRKTLRVELAVQSLLTETGWKSVDSRAWISMPMDAPVVPDPGDEVVVRAQLTIPNGPMNPEEFDYRRYLWNKGIAWIGYAPAGTYQIVKTKKDRFNPLFWSVYVSQWADRQFRANIQDDRSYGLVKAMLLGRRDDLRTDQIDDYTTSGTVHILSVSGMHVALIFLVISFIFGWIKRLRGGKYLYLATVTLLLIFYSIVTGFPPSVQRATLMCIVLAIAEVFQKKHHAVNTLGVSAFIILLLDPLALYDVGFQLSYLAMLGIFLFYKSLENIWTPSSWLLQKVWQVTALSFAAQLATFPLSIYYFHQFPSYFWLVNPFVIAFTNALLPASVVMLFVSLFPVDFLQMVVNLVVQALAYLTNLSAGVPKLFPGYLVDNLYLDGVEIVLLYLVLLLIWLSFENRNYRWLKLIPATILIFVIYASSISLQSYLVPAAMVHSVPKHSVISFKEGEKLYIACDPEFATDTNAYNFHIRNYAVKEGALERIFINGDESIAQKDMYFRNVEGSQLIGFSGRTIYEGAKPVNNEFIDYQLLEYSRYPRAQKLELAGQPVFLLGGNMGKKTREQWKRIVKQNGFVCHDLMTDGALLLR
jgi:competence protein ComEC